MQNIKKYFMTLALLLTAVTGAWAQSTFGVKEITADMLPASWSTDESAVTADDLAKLGFMEVTEAEAQAWTGAPQQGNVRLIYTLCESVNWVNGEGGYVTSSYTRKIFYSCLDGQRIFITTELTEWSLTPDADKKVWTLAKMPASDIELQVEYEPTKVTMAVNDKTMGTLEVAGESKVEWTADTWKGWTFNTKDYTVDDITMTSSKDAYINEITEAGDYLHSLSFFVNQWEDNSTVTFSTTGDPFSRIEFTMIDNYGEYNPNIKPNDNWTFEGKSAVWEGEATKSLTLQSCSTEVSKITFFQGGVPEGVTVNGDGTFTVAKTATVTLKAIPAEGYKFLYWEDDQTNTNPVREVTIESGMADMTYKAVFAANEYNITFVEGTNPDPENPEWTATPNPAKTKQTVTVTYSGERKVMGVKAEKKAAKPATLADALVDGATVVIAFSYGNLATNTFTNNNGTFTLTDATGFGAAADETTQLTADGSNLIFKANWDTSIDNNWSNCGFQVTIDTTDNTYVVWKSGTAQGYSAKFTSITVNGTEIQLSELK